MINSIANSIRVCIFNAQMSDQSKLARSVPQNVLDDFSKLAAEVILVRNIGYTKSQFKTDAYNLCEISVGEEPLLIAVKADRFSILSNSLNLLNKDLNGGKVKCIGIKLMLLENQTNKVSAIALLNFSFQFFDLQEDVDKDLLKKIEMEKWLNLNKEVQNLEKSRSEVSANQNESSVGYSSYTSSITYDNIKKLMKTPEAKEKNKNIHEEKKHTGLSKIYHSIVDHKHHPIEPPVVVKNLYDHVNFDTVLCAVSIDHRLGSSHKFDNGERFHTFEFNSINDNVIRSMSYFGSAMIT